MSTKKTLPEAPQPEATEEVKYVSLKKSTCVVTVPEGPIADSWRESGFEEI